MVALRILICLVFAVLCAGMAAFSSTDVLFNRSAPVVTTAVAVVGVSTLLMFGAVLVLQRSRYTYKTTILLGVALVLLAAQLPLQDGAQSFVRDVYDKRWQRVEAGLRVSALDDQPLRADSGAPLGVRVVLTLESAEDAELAFSLFAEAPGPRTLSLLPVRRMRDPPFDPGSDLFRAGQAYRLTYDLAPSILGWDPDQARYCLRYKLDAAFLQLQSDLGATPLKLEFGGVRFAGTPQTWDFEAQTKESYDLAVFMESVLTGDFPLCTPTS